MSTFKIDIINYYRIVNFKKGILTQRIQIGYGYTSYTLLCTPLRQNSRIQDLKFYLHYY